MTYHPSPNLLKCQVPEQAVGNYYIEHFEISGQEALIYNLQSLDMLLGHTRGVAPGKYTRLVKRHGLTLNPETIMSDTPAEILEHLPFIFHAHGEVLITGLGLGIVAQAVACHPAVKTVTVIELSQDVITMTAPHMPHNVTVLHGNAFGFNLDLLKQPYDCAWHDIWPDLNIDNLRDMKSLVKQFAGIVVGKQACWGEEACLLAHYKTEENYHDATRAL